MLSNNKEKEEEFACVQKSWFYFS